ncbi:CATG protein, partial [Psophia crepitans]|nr:CATG protein [Psophia crepitans]
LLLANAFLLLPWAGAGRIIGGREAEPHSRPYMAYLSIHSESGVSTCGGFLIRADAVVSAAHCVAGKKKVNVTVTLGAHNIKKNEPTQQKFHIGHWVIHPNYSGDTYENDIMLLKLKPRAKLTQSVSYIPLASRKERVELGILCKMAGWGRTSMPVGDVSSVLMEVDLKVQRSKTCTQSFKRYQPASMICVGDKNGKKATYRGDSGGPLVCNRKAHGILAYGSKYCIFPKVFSRVSHFDPWIRAELRKFALL